MGYRRSARGAGHITNPASRAQGFGHHGLFAPLYCFFDADGLKTTGFLAFPASPTKICIHSIYHAFGHNFLFGQYHDGPGDSAVGLSNAFSGKNVAKTSRVKKPEDLVLKLMPIVRPASTR